AGSRTSCRPGTPDGAVPDTRGRSRPPACARRPGRSTMNGTMARHIYQLRISLDGVEPPVWRRLLIPGGYTLDRLHRAIQYVMGWQNCHLHSFEIDGEHYAEPDPAGGLPVHDELDFRVDAVLTKGGRARYTYDFGDWWEHNLVVEDVVPADIDE